MVSMAALKIICLVAVLRGCINTIIINRCRLPEIIALYDQGDEQARAHVERYLDLLAVCGEIS
ncbi:hypothetical protein ACLBR5_21135 [Escherichia coli]